MTPFQGILFARPNSRAFDTASHFTRQNAAKDGGWNRVVEFLPCKNSELLFRMDAK
jgi:hypothetical protein